MLFSDRKDKSKSIDFLDKLTDQLLTKAQMIIAELYQIQVRNFAEIESLMKGKYLTYMAVHSNKSLVALYTLLKLNKALDLMRRGFGERSELDKWFAEPQNAERDENDSTEVFQNRFNEIIFKIKHQFPQDVWGLALKQIEDCDLVKGVTSIESDLDKKPFYSCFSVEQSDCAWHDFSDADTCKEIFFEGLNELHWPFSIARESFSQRMVNAKLIIVPKNKFSQEVEAKFSTEYSPHIYILIHFFNPEDACSFARMCEVLAIVQNDNFCVIQDSLQADNPPCNLNTIKLLDGSSRVLLSVDYWLLAQMRINHKNLLCETDDTMGLKDFPAGLRQGDSYSDTILSCIALAFQEYNRITAVIPQAWGLELARSLVSFWHNFLRTDDAEPSDDSLPGAFFDAVAPNFMAGNDSSCSGSTSLLASAQVNWMRSQEACASIQQVRHNLPNQFRKLFNDTKVEEVFCKILRLAIEKMYPIYRYQQQSENNVCLKSPLSQEIPWRPYTQRALIRLLHKFESEYLQERPRNMDQIEPARPR